MTDSYIPARPTTYQPARGGPSITMRSRLEAYIAAALDNLLVEWEYEPRAYATSSGQYLPDFAVKNVRTITDNETWPVGDILIEGVATLEKFEARWPRERAIVHLRDDAPPLFYVGWGKHPLLYGWCFTPESKTKHLAALGRYHDEPALFLDLLAYAWLDGYWQHAKDEAIAGQN